MIRTRVFALVTAVALAAAGCGGEAKKTAQPASPAPGSASPAPSSAPAADVVTINVAVKNHKVVPRATVHKVTKGKTVRITVTSDQADEVHVHGYNKESEVAAGASTTIQFTANLSGRFEVETHKSNLQLFLLQVS
jgi:plastocyanin